MTQIIDLGKLRFHFAGDWLAATIYEANDIVKYGGNVYCYTFALAQAGILPTDTTHWALMVKGFNFTGNYSATQQYHVGEAVAYGGKVYVAIADNSGQIPPAPACWSQFADGIEYAGVYSGTTSYKKNDIATYGGCVYIALQDTTNNLPTVASYWAPFVTGINPQGVYNAASAYVPGDVVAYGANLYRAIANSTGNSPTNAAYWAPLLAGLAFQGVYAAATQYHANDIVSYGANLYRATSETLGNLPTNAGYWTAIVYGSQFLGAYVAATAYHRNDIVNYGGNAYIALRDTTGNLPTDTNNWALYISGSAPQGVWSAAVAYPIGSLVTYGPSLYRSLVNTSVGDLPTNPAKFALQMSGLGNRGAWITATAYYPGEVVTYGGQSFICTTYHASTAFATDLVANWQSFTSGIRWRGNWTTATAYLANDIFTDGISTYIAAVDHTSSASVAADVAASKVQTLALGQSVLPSMLNKAGKILGNDGVNPVWQDSKLPITYVNGAMTMVDGGWYLVDTSAGSFSLTLPLAPAANAQIRLYDGAGTFNSYPLTALRNGEKIAGIADDLFVNVQGASLTFLYVNSTIGWRVF